jgi:hypothetical protein
MDFGDTTSALARTQSIINDVGRLAVVADAAATQYAQRERVLHAIAEDLSSRLMWSVGALFPAIVATAGPLVIGGVAVAVVLAASGKLAPGTPWERRLRTLGASLTNTVGFSRATALAMSGLDDFVAGVAGMPVLSTGATSPAPVASGLAIAAAVLHSPVLGETPVRVHPVGVAATDQPALSLGNLVERIPHAADGAPQIRIERYPSGVSVVYLGGTIDAEPDPQTEPWDMTSNVAALAGLDAGSYRAAQDAMRQAGISATDPVVLVGHSQGGLVAARLAASGNFAVSDVLTVGAPIHHVAVPSSVHVVALEHAEDLVPSLSGVSLAGAAVAGAAGSNRLTVSRRLYPAGGATTSTFLPAHSLTRYVETAQSMDASADPRLAEVRARLTANTQSPPTVTFWRAERVRSG